MTQGYAAMQPPTITFSLPEGREQVNPAPEALRDLILKGGDDFWAVGSGQAALEFKGNEAGSRLLLMGLHSEGFFLIYEPAKGASLASINPTVPEVDDESIELYVGGEPMEVPRSNFLDRETAWRVIGDFLHDGKPSPRVNWEAWL
jgi:hypothetical protein